MPETAVQLRQEGGSDYAFGMRFGELLLGFIHTDWMVALSHSRLPPPAFVFACSVSTRQCKLPASCAAQHQKEAG